MPSATLKIRGGCQIDSNGRGAGKGALVQWEKSGTLGVSQDQTLFVWKGDGVAYEIYHSGESSKRFKSEDS